MSDSKCVCEGCKAPVDCDSLYYVSDGCCANCINGVAPDAGPSFLKGPTFFDRVRMERNQQRARWGDAHDDAHTPAEWALIVLRYAGRLGEAFEATWQPQRPWVSKANIREQAIKLAAVCLALDEAIQRELDREKA